MAKQPKSTTMIDLANVIVDRMFNVRDSEGYDVTSLIESLTAVGQQEPAFLEKMPDGKYRPLRGSRRATALQEMQGKGIKFEGGEQAGKVPTQIKAFVYEGLNDRERVELLLDHGTRKGLSPVEVFYAFERAFEAAYTEEQVAALLRDLIDQHWPMRKQLEAQPGTAEYNKEYFNHRRGVIQTNKRAWRAPELLRDAWVNKLRGKQAWPTKAEMEELSDVHVKEAAADKANVISRKNPGPKFMERWNKLVAAQQEAAANGDSRAKSQSMMSRTQVEDRKKVVDSRCLKFALDIVLNRISTDKLPVLDKVMVKLEEGLTDELRGILNSIATTEPETPAPTPTPAA